MIKILAQRSLWLVVLFAALWVSAKVRYRQLRHRFATLWATTVSLKAVDDSSGAALPTTVGDIPGLSAEHDYLPWVAIGTSTDGIQRLTVASDEPVSLRVSSEGYPEEPVTIDRSTIGERIVRLKKR
jgi:hypothetical protein